MNWHYKDTSGTSVAFKESEVKRLSNSGILLPSTEVWKPGMDSWKQAAQTELAPLFPISNAERRYADNAVSNYTFEDPSLRVRKLGRSLKIYITGAVFCTISDVTQAANGVVISEDFTAIDAISLFGSLAFLCGLIASGIGFMRWSKLVSQNAHAISGLKLKYSPKFAMWSYLIPFVNFWIPRVAIGEIWQTSYSKVQRGEPPSRSLLNIWWSLFIVSAFIDELVAKSTSESVDALWLSAGSFALNILLGVVAIRVVQAVSSPQLAYAEATT